MILSFWERSALFGDRKFCRAIGPERSFHSEYGRFTKSLNISRHFGSHSFARSVVTTFSALRSSSLIVRSATQEVEIDHLRAVLNQGHHLRLAARRSRRQIHLMLPSGRPLRAVVPPVYLAPLHSLCHQQSCQPEAHLSFGGSPRTEFFGGEQWTGASFANVGPGIPFNGGQISTRSSFGGRR